MMPQKGAPLILDAAPLVWKRHPDARFIFIGPATDLELKAFDGRDARITYLGKVPSQEKADALAACDIFCMPSISEILPTVYLEAWMFGKPVIGGLADGLRELVEGNRAGICSSSEPQELSSAISRLLDDGALRAELGNHGLNLVTRNYSIESIAGRLESLYEGLVKGRNRIAGIPYRG
jgi:glycosyltransferase involved in cell wall biosynthesis